MPFIIDDIKNRPPLLSQGVRKSSVTHFDIQASPPIQEKNLRALDFFYPRAVGLITNYLIDNKEPVPEQLKQWRKYKVTFYQSSEKHMALEVPIYEVLHTVLDRDLYLEVAISHMINTPRLIITRTNLQYKAESFLFLDPHNDIELETNYLETALKRYQ